MNIVNLYPALESAVANGMAASLNLPLLAAQVAQETVNQIPLRKGVCRGLLASAIAEEQLALVTRLGLSSKPPKDFDPPPLSKTFCQNMRACFERGGDRFWFSDHDPRAELREERAVVLDRRRVAGSVAFSTLVELGFFRIGVSLSAAFTPVPDTLKEFFRDGGEYGILLYLDIGRFFESNGEDALWIDGRVQSKTREKAEPHDVFDVQSHRISRWNIANPSWKFEFPGSETHPEKIDALKVIQTEIRRVIELF